MKNLFLLLPCFLLVFSVRSFGQDSTSDANQVYMEYMTPGPMHEMLADAVGDWDTKSTYRMNPGDDPVVSQGTTKVEMILGGRYQKSTTTSEMMGMPFEGISLTAFDNAAKEFINTWIDNMGTGIMISKGKYDEAVKKVVMKGTYSDPMTKNDEPFMETYEVVDKDHHKLEMFTYPGGQEFKTMVVEYTRKNGM